MLLQHLSRSIKKLYIRFTRLSNYTLNHVLHVVLFDCFVNSDLKKKKKLFF